MNYGIHTLRGCLLWVFYLTVYKLITDKIHKIFL